MKHIQPSSWRKGIVLSATFLFASLMMFSCKKKETTLGQNSIDQNNLLSSAGIDTFTLTTYTIEEDSARTDASLFSLLGSYDDPEFGPVNAEIYTQIKMSTETVDFGDVSTITSVDSFIVGLEYAGSYGNPITFDLEVFRITDPDPLHLDSNYYAFSTKIVDNTDNLILAGHESQELNTDGVTVIGSDTTSRKQLRIPLDTNLARTFIDDAALNNPTAFSSNEEFLNYFKGLYIRVNPSSVNSLMPGDGGVFYFNPTGSRVSIYYTQDGVQKSYDFSMNSSECANLNHIDIDNTSKQVETVISDSTFGQEEFYAQSFKSQAVIEFPGIENLPKDAVIHSATLELPVQYQTGADFPPGLDLTVTTRLTEDDDELYSIGVLGPYDNYKKQFSINLRNYVQEVVNGNVEHTELIVYPILFFTTVERIIFNGPDSGNKAQPKLTVVYTEF
ncbi:MAG: DUF4270 domain-containing protein [Crocinitomicaceae bacterium]|nr:DUF4270 domain-containing protein [Crocinitomicaceae bacterium]